MGIQCMPSQIGIDGEWGYDACPGRLELMVNWDTMRALADWIDGKWGYNAYSRYKRLKF